MTFGAIPWLTILDKGWGVSKLVPPCIYHVNVDWRPAEEVHLLLDVYVLPSTKAVTHFLIVHQKLSQQL